MVECMPSILKALIQSSAPPKIYKLKVNINKYRAGQ
jgi:hypothetical protein